MTSASIGLFRNFPGLDVEYLVWQSSFGQITFSRDALIVASFTAFTIALIPIVWIYFLASSRARWVVMGFGFLKLAIYLFVSPNWYLGLFRGFPGLITFLEPILIFVALGMLWMPGMKEWLNPSGRDARADFE
ncbi:MAG: hypothetical protein AAF559_04885 [Pseudomonadota bacterium]